MADFKVLRTFHTGICVADLDWTVGFFGDVLGYTLIDKAPRDPKNHSFITGVPGVAVTIAYMQGPGHAIELLEYSGPEDREHYRPRAVDVGHFHLCLVVDDVAAAVAACTAYDEAIETLSPMPMEVDQGPNKGNKIQFVRLPDGVVIEFTTRRQD